MKADEESKKPSNTNDYVRKRENERDHLSSILGRITNRNRNATKFECHDEKERPPERISSCSSAPLIKIPKMDGRPAGRARERARDKPVARAGSIACNSFACNSFAYTRTGGRGTKNNWDAMVETN